MGRKKNLLRIHDVRAVRVYVVAMCAPPSIGFVAAGSVVHRALIPHALHARFLRDACVCRCRWWVGKHLKTNPNPIVGPETRRTFVCLFVFAKKNNINNK
jgi:hypothetical protein